MVRIGIDERRVGIGGLEQKKEASISFSCDFLPLLTLRGLGQMLCSIPVSRSD